MANESLRARGSPTVPTNMALRMRGTTVAPPDPPPTPLGQGGIGSDTVADQIAPPSNPALRARGSEYAKGGSAKKLPDPPPTPPARPPQPNDFADKEKEDMDNFQDSIREQKDQQMNTPSMKRATDYINPTSDLNEQGRVGYAKGGSVKAGWRKWGW